MDDILKFLLKNCSYLYNSFGFRFVDSKVSDSFGGDALLVLANDSVQVRFVRDRGQLFFDLQPKGFKNWYSIDLIRAMVGNQEVFKSVMDEDNAIFLKSNFKAILNSFSQGRTKGTIEKLEKLKKVRSRQLFG